MPYTLGIDEDTGQFLRLTKGTVSTSNVIPITISEGSIVVPTEYFVAAGIISSSDNNNSTAYLKYPECDILDSTGLNVSPTSTRKWTSDGYSISGLPSGTYYIKASGIVGNTGKQGVQGPPGPQGIQGPPGPQGPEGKGITIDARDVLSNKHIYDNEVIGFVFLAVDTGHLYIKKSSDPGDWLGPIALNSGLPDPIEVNITGNDVSLDIIHSNYVYHLTDPVNTLNIAKIDPSVRYVTIFLTTAEVPRITVPNTSLLCGIPRAVGGTKYMINIGNSIVCINQLNSMYTDIGVPTLS